jgi:hypothetical protein
MESFLSYYKSHWNPLYNGSESELSLVLDRAADIVGNAAETLSLDLTRVPFYLLDNIYKAVCSEVDYILRSGGAAALTEQSAEGESVKIGRFSVSGTGVKRSVDFTLCDEARSYLFKTNLLHRSVAVV